MEYKLVKGKMKSLGTWKSWFYDSFNVRLRGRSEENNF